MSCVNEPTTHREGEPSARTKRAAGSTLLLRKIALSARARQYCSDAMLTARHEDSSSRVERGMGDDPQSECNTLAFGPHTYRILALIRACEGLLRRRSPLDNAASVHHRDRDDDYANHTRSYATPEDTENEAFTATHLWGCATGVGEPDSDDEEDMAQLIDAAAMTLPLPRVLSAPSTVSRQGKRDRARGGGGGTDVDRAAAQGKRTRLYQESYQKQQQQQQREQSDARRTENQESNAQDDDRVGADDESDKDELEKHGLGEAYSLRREWWSVPGAVQEALPSYLYRNDVAYQRRSMSQGDERVMPCYFVALERWCSASDEARYVGCCVRQPLPMPSATTALSLDGMNDEARSTVPYSPRTAAAAQGHSSSPGEWGSRMQRLVQHRIDHPSAFVSSSSPPAASPADRAQLATYLRRVAWLQRRQGTSLAVQPLQSTASGSGDGGHLTDFSTSLTWDTMSEAERVRMEMEHVQQQRRRFSRSRGGDAEDVVIAEEEQN